MDTLIFSSSMLDLASFRGLLPVRIRGLPAVVYFHENQLTYPLREESDRDYHLVFTNLSTALSSDRVWFNSAYHRDDFLSGLPRFLRRMPDYRPHEAIEEIRSRSEIHSQGIDSFPRCASRSPGPLRLLWAARWEYDKGPEIFFQALDIFAGRGINFELAVIGGGNARQVPECFSRAREKYGEQIRYWGYLESREKYREALLWADLAVSTARHEFFGISMVEAAAAGCYPLVPRRLSYPEIFSADGEIMEEFFYQGSAAALADRLSSLAVEEDIWSGAPDRLVRLMEKYSWDNLVPLWDEALKGVNRESR